MNPGDLPLLRESPLLRDHTPPQAASPRAPEAFPPSRDALPVADAFRPAHESFPLLREAVAAAEDGRHRDLEAVLARVRGTLDPDAEPGDVLAMYYVEGLSRRLGGRPSANLYLRRYENPQIDLFYLLGRHLPFVRVGRLANAHLLEHLDGGAAATLLSIGIGQGRQEVELLAGAASRGLRRLVVVGVDPAAGSLAAARSALLRAGADHGVAVTFHPVPQATEDLSDDFWSLVERCPGPLLATASFALHHMVDTRPGQDARDVFLRRLRAARPAAVALCEPDSDHHRVSLAERFHNSWRMFGTLFEAIDATPASRAEQNAMKDFFGREILNIVGAADEWSRFERHEPTTAWLARLRRCGFRTTTPVVGDETARDLTAPPGVALSAEPDLVRLGYRGVPLVSVLTAVS